MNTILQDVQHSIGQSFDAAKRDCGSDDSWGESLTFNQTTTDGKHLARLVWMHTRTNN
ncbi:MAG: hypothetical protein ACRD63_07530 [Pyrinomonadaceae bacterium]